MMNIDENDAVVQTGADTTEPLNFTNVKPGDSLLSDEDKAAFERDYPALAGNTNTDEAVPANDQVLQVLGAGDDGVVTQADAATSTQVAAVADATEAPVTAETEAVSVDNVSTSAPVEDKHVSVEADAETDKLIAEKEELEAKITARRKEKQAIAINEIKTVVDTYKIPLQDIIDALGGLPKGTRKGQKAAIKYRDTEGHEWSGRGKEPLWIKGKDKAQFAV